MNQDYSHPFNVSDLQRLRSRPMLQGKAAVMVLGCYNGPEADGEAAFQPMRTLGTPLLDTFARFPFSQIATISNDPIDASPLHFYNEHKTLRDVTPMRSLRS